MTIGGLVLLLIVAAICGALGQAIAGYSSGGCLISIVLGFAGAFAGMWLAGQLGLPQFIPLEVQGESFPIIWSVIGSALLALVFGVISRAGRRRG